MSILSQSSEHLCRIVRKLSCFETAPVRGLLSTSACRNDSTNTFAPSLKIRPGETIEKKRSRLLYQSRKRGMLENGLLLSTFASKYLSKFNLNQLEVYDELINMPSNDWDIYYWATGLKPTPIEFDTNIMELLKEHVKNGKKETRYFQPDL